MKKFHVQVTHVTSLDLTVLANNEDEAEELVHDAYYNRDLDRRIVIAATHTILDLTNAEDGLLHADVVDVFGEDVDGTPGITDEDPDDWRFDSSTPISDAAAEDGDEDYFAKLAGAEENEHNHTRKI